MQRALIVDDSRTARVALRQMLVRHHFDVEMVESAESALDYLKTQTPYVIFMDHLMPGMDGFEALRAIKSNPACAAVPIVMYTSKEGDVYVGQARALGAVDILTKPARSEELEQVLARVEHYVHTEAPVPSIEVLTIEEEVSEEEPAPHARTLEMPVVADQHRPPSSIMIPAVPEDVLPPPAVRARRGWMGWSVAAVAAGVAVAMFVQLRAVTAERERAWEGIEWALNQGAQYPFGQLPLGDERLVMIEGLLDQLKASGFRGTVRLDGYAGDYCLVRGGEGSQSLVLPAPNVLRSGCDRVGLSEDDARWLSVAQSPRFKEFLRSSPVLAEGRINIEVVGHGRDNNLVNYPAVTGQVTSGEWNEVARVNSRVELVLLPATPLSPFDFFSRW